MLGRQAKDTIRSLDLCSFQRILVSLELCVYYPRHHYTSNKHTCMGVTLHMVSDMSCYKYNDYLHMLPRFD